MLDKPEEANNIECDTRFKTSNSILVAKKKKILENTDWCCQYVDIFK